MDENEVQLNDLMIARADALDNGVYYLLITLLEIHPDEAEKEFPWDIEIIREVLDSTIEILGQHGKSVCNPYIEHKAGKSSLCNPNDCGCKGCNCRMLPV